MKLYEQYAWVYHTLYPAIWDYVSIAKTCAKILEAAGCQSVLDIGCGTGLLTKLLISHGFGVMGVDASPLMLAIARKHVPGTKFLVGDIRYLDAMLGDWTGTFDAIVCMGRVFDHLITYPDVFSCLKAVFHSLCPGGLFLLDVWDASAIFSNFQLHAVETTTVGPLVFNRTFDREMHLDGHWAYQLRTHFTVTNSDNVVADFKDQGMFRAFLPDELFLSLKISRFDPIRFDNPPFLPGVFWVAARRPV